jgi:hypothetical protein
MYNEELAQKVVEYLNSKVFSTKGKMLIMTLLTNEDREIYEVVLTKLIKIWENIRPYDIKYSLKAIDDTILNGGEQKYSLIQEFRKIEVDLSDYINNYELILRAESYAVDYFQKEVFHKMFAKEVTEYLSEQPLSNKSKALILSLISNERSELNQKIQLSLKEKWQNISPIDFKYNLEAIYEAYELGGTSYDSLIQEYAKLDVSPEGIIKCKRLIIRAEEFAFYQLAGIEKFQDYIEVLKSDIVRKATIQGQDLENIKNKVEEIQLFYDKIEFFQKIVNNEKTHNQYFPSEYSEFSIKEVFKTLESEGFIEQNDNLELLFKEEIPSKNNRIVWRKNLPQLVFLAKRIWGSPYSGQFNDIIVTLFKLESGKELTKSGISTAHSAINKTIMKKSVNNYTMKYRMLHNIAQKLVKVV